MIQDSFDSDPYTQRDSILPQEGFIKEENYSKGMPGDLQSMDQ